MIDTPPGTSDEHMSVVKYLEGCGVDGAVVVTTPQVMYGAALGIATHPLCIRLPLSGTGVNTQRVVGDIVAVAAYCDDTFFFRKALLSLMLALMLILLLLGRPPLLLCHRRNRPPCWNMTA